MNNYIIDSHIHLDLYEKEDCQQILNSLKEYNVKAVVAVSNHLSSSEKTLQMAMENEMVKPAFGYHPEQQLPSEENLWKLFKFIHEHENNMVAIGEVGLPYYLRQKSQEVKREPYIEVLEQFIKKASVFNKPIVLHAIYDDAPIVCDLLESYSYFKVHFHWFKGDETTLLRMKENGYYISITPEVLYKGEIREIVKNYPLSQMMVETDGPWPFEGPFKAQMTQPKMIHSVINEISSIKGLDINYVYRRLYRNTESFYNIK